MLLTHLRVPFLALTLSASHADALQEQASDDGASASEPLIANYSLARSVAPALVPAPLSSTVYISHENDGFHSVGFSMKAGLDNKLYLWSNSYVMRINPDGTKKEGTETICPGDPAITGVIANAAGVIGVAVAHFQSRVVVAEPDWTQVGFTGNFYHGDTRYGAPCDVAVGASGSFYGVDQYENSIVRVSDKNAQQMDVYSITSTGNFSFSRGIALGVCEANSLFLLHEQDTNNISAVSFNNNLLWKHHGISAPAFVGSSGGWGVVNHVDPVACVMYVMSPNNLNVTVIDGKTGTVTKSIPLQWEPALLHPPPGNQLIVESLAVIGGNFHIKIDHPTELFRTFAPTGQLVRAVHANIDVITMTVQGLPDQGLPNNLVVEPGSTVNLNLDFTLGDSTGTGDPPEFSAWIRRYHSPEFEKLDWSRIEQPNIQIPNSTGLYQLRVTPGIRGTNSAFEVDSLLEVRPARNIIGSASIFTGAVGPPPITQPGYLPTTFGRYYWAQNEAMNFTVRLRVNDTMVNATGTAPPTSLALQIMENSGRAGDSVVASLPSRMLVGGVTTWIIPGNLTATWPVGRYLATISPAEAAEAKLTVVPHPFAIGRAFEKPSFKINQYGDYGPCWPTPETPPGLDPIFTAPEAVETHLQRSEMMGINMYVDRAIQSGQAIAQPAPNVNPALSIQTRVAVDNLSVALETLYAPNVPARAIPGHGANGIEQRMILINMDGGLPIGTGFDTRTGAQFGDALAIGTSNAMESTAFTGWSWAANWWVAPYGCAALTKPTDVAACTAALVSAKTNGTWSPLFDTAADIWMNYAPTAERQFKANVSKIMPTATSSVTGPYRAIGVHPPTWFADAEEVDLHFQSEQIQPPQTAAHNVEYQGRPGKPKWAHYEMNNDDGTGQFMMNDQIQMLMRGVTGVGWSGPLLNGNVDNDVRDGSNGIVGAFRAFNTAVLRDYGPWFAQLNKTDDVALVVSTKMLKIDAWGKLGGWYFDQLWETWTSLFYAGMPATFVFSEDVSRYGVAGLTKFKAVMVSGQKVPLDPPLAAALTQAAKSGVFVCYDETTIAAAAMPAGSHALPWAFNFTESAAAENAWQDDSAYQRYQDYWLSAAVALRTVLLPVVKPATNSGNLQVLMSTLHPSDTATPGRFVWATNNQLLGLSPGIVWRVTNIQNQRIPHVACVALGASASEQVYDVFANKLVTATGNCTNADLRNLPGRLFAILPSKITGVSVTAKLDTGVLSMTAAVAGPQTLVPAKLVIATSTGKLINKQAISIPPTGWNGSFAVGVSSTINTFVVTVVELFGGMSGNASATPALPELSALSVDATTATATAPHEPADQSFGMHFKSVVANKAGTILALNAFNLDQNLLGIDTTTGAVAWRARLGHYWSYAPTVSADSDTFLAQGFDLNNANGMQLYAGIDPKTGTPTHRYSLPAYPDRGASWAWAWGLGEPYHYAFAAGNGWAAASGDLAIAAWDSQTGVGLWSKPWYNTTRQYLFIVAMGPDKLIIVEPNGLNVSAVIGKTGTPVWTVQPTLSGTLLGAVASADGSTLAVWGTTGLFVIRNGNVTHTIGVAAVAVSISADGMLLATTSNGIDKMAKNLQVFAIRDRWHMLWSYHAMEVVRNPEFSANGKLLAFGNDIGQVYVADVQSGAIAWEDDLGSSCSFTFLPDGALVAASWMGRVAVYEPLTYATRWSVVVQSTSTDLPTTFLRPDPTPKTFQLSGLTNAETTMWATGANMLNHTQTIISAVVPPKESAASPWNFPQDSLTDGNVTSPGLWLPWDVIEMIDSGWEADMYIYIDGFHTMFQVDAIGFIEDPMQPSSWLRDMKLEWYNKNTGLWQFHQYLLSDSAIHVHTLDIPCNATKLRLGKSAPSTTAAWPVGNIGLAELALLGTNLGCSHPDVQAKKPVAVLFDEDNTDVNLAFQNGFNPVWENLFGATVAYSGDKAIGLRAPGQTYVQPGWNGLFASAVPDFCFHVRATPVAGEYRYLQYAWKALDPQTTAIGFWIGEDGGSQGAYGFVAGVQKWATKPWNEAKETSVAPVVPKAWTVVTQDLWIFANISLNVTAMAFGSVGGGAAFDQIILCATLAECQATKPLPH